jgi:hypothetical protein
MKRWIVDRCRYLVMGDKANYWFFASAFLWGVFASISIFFSGRNAIGVVLLALLFLLILLLWGTYYSLKKREQYATLSERDIDKNTLYRLLAKIPNQNYGNYVHLEGPMGRFFARIDTLWKTIGKFEVGQRFVLIDPSAKNEIYTKFYQLNDQILASREHKFFLPSINYLGFPLILNCDRDGLFSACEERVYVLDFTSKEEESEEEKE